MDPVYRTSHHRQEGYFIKEMTFSTPSHQSNSSFQLLQLLKVRHSHLCRIHSVTPCSVSTLQCCLELLPYSLAYIVACYTASPWDERQLVCHFLALADALARLQRLDIAHLRLSLDHLMVSQDLSTIQLISFASNAQLSVSPETRFQQDIRALGMCFLKVAYIGQSLESIAEQQRIPMALEGLKSYGALREVLGRALETRADALTIMREFGSFSLCPNCAFCRNRQQTWSSSLDCSPVIANSEVRLCQHCKRLLDKIGEEKAVICGICCLTSKPPPIHIPEADPPRQKCQNPRCGNSYDPRISFTPNGFCSDQCYYESSKFQQSSQRHCQNCGASFTPASTHPPDFKNFCSEDCGLSYTYKVSLNAKT